MARIIKKYNFTPKNTEGSASKPSAENNHIELFGSCAEFSLIVERRKFLKEGDSARQPARIINYMGVVCNVMSSLSGFLRPLQLKDVTDKGNRALFFPLPDSLLRLFEGKMVII